MRSSLFVLLLVAAAACSGDDNGFVDHDSAPPLDVAPQVDAAADLFLQLDSTVGPPVTLTVATFNVENFFDELDDPDHLDDVYSAADVAAKITALGKALRQLKADVLALQEVENKPLLQQLNTQELATLGYAHVHLFEGNDVRGIDLALLSRYPVPKAISHVNDHFKGVDGDDTTYGFSRDCLEATIEPSPGRRLILLVNHLAATNWQNRAESIARREAQANRVREIVDQNLVAYPGANLAVVGDLNDTPDSKTIQLIRDGNPALVDLLTLVPAAERYTTDFSGTKEQFDYILVSPGLMTDLVQGSVLADHAAVFKDVSDHYPVIARFTLQ
jgi:endonuclease/exonuclease/phosphatase family metal-dependent hydrolase